MMRRTLICVLLGAGATVAATAATAEADRPGALSWRQSSNSVALLNGEKVVWQHHHDKTEGKPYLHPLGTVDGDVLTWLRPNDHPWHRALWLSWKYINDVNYWEENRKTGQADGLTELLDVSVKTGSDFSARIEMTLSYHPPEKPELMSEKRLIVISPPDRSGRYTVDWSSTFKAAGGDVELSRTPIPGEEGGRGHGGYAGVSIRMAEATRGWSFADSEGRTGKDIHGKNAQWVNAVGKTPSGANAGVAMFDHPANMRHSSPWYLAEGMPYYSPALLFDEPFTLKHGESFSLKYRVLVHPGWTDKEKLNAEWEAFTTGTREEIGVLPNKMGHGAGGKDLNLVSAGRHASVRQTQGLPDPAGFAGHRPTRSCGGP